MSEANREPSVFEATPLRMDHATIFLALQQLNRTVTDLAGVVGKPATEDGGQPASGIFAHLRDHKNRITRFERMWERGVGFAVAVVPSATLVWWLAGDKLAKLFH